MLEYKGYYGFVQFDKKNRYYNIDVINSSFIVTFNIKNLDEVEKKFQNVIDKYDFFCSRKGINPKNMIMNGLL